MDDLKIIYPTEVPETPFPGEPEATAPTAQPNPIGTFTPSTVKEKTFPKKRTAVELLSTALNTRSKKILQEFELQDTGGFKVGDFKKGISGDLRITPNGLTARNIAGLTTFAIDGDTGDAFFLGIIRAGSILSETIIEASEINGGSININENFTVNGDGDVVIGNENGVPNSSLNFYDNEGTLQGILNGDVGVNKFMRWNHVALGETYFYETATTLTNELARITVDEGFMVTAGKGVTVQGTTGINNEGTNSATIYTDESGGKQRLMVIFPTGAAQVIATEP